MSVTPGEYRYMSPFVAKHPVEDVPGLNASRVVSDNSAVDAESTLRGLGVQMTRYASSLRPLPSSSVRVVDEQSGGPKLSSPEVRGRDVLRGMRETTWDQAYHVLHAGTDKERQCVATALVDQSTSMRIGSNARLLARQGKTTR